MNVTNIQKTIADLQKERSALAVQVQQLDSVLGGLKAFAGDNGSASATAAPARSTPAPAAPAKRRGRPPKATASANGTAAVASKKSTRARAKRGTSASTQPWPKEGTAAAKMIEVLDGAAKTAKELAEELGVGGSTVFPLLRKALELGLVVKHDDGSGYSRAETTEVGNAAATA